MSNKELTQNQVRGCLAAFFMSIIVALFYEYFQKQSLSANAAFRKYDFVNCTASDYSIRVDLPKKWYAAY
jgi:hypothetical protein